MSRAENEPEERPGWLYPLILFAITALIGVAILWFYVGPGIDDITGARIKPTSEAESAAVSIAGQTFTIPANYIRLPSARSGGEMNEIELDALLPDLHGFMADDAEAIKDVSRRSPVISIIIKAGAPEMTERDRYERIYARNADPARKPFDYAGFKVTPLADTSGYAGQHVFTRQAGDDFVVILCDGDDTTNNIGGLCLRDMAWGDGLTIVYSFRGGHLDQWTELDAAVKTLIGAFKAPSK